MSLSARDSTRGLSAAIRTRAIDLGFDAVGITLVEPSHHAGFLQRWLEEGRAGEMTYLLRPDAVEKRLDPTRLVPGARSAIVVACDYFPGGDPRSDGVGPDRAIFARYARNEDYHDLLKDRLIEMQAWIGEQVSELGGRAYVDTGAVLERELARRAGIGWFGRNTMLIRPGAGSYCFLGVVLVDIPLEADAPFDDDLCGTCTACLAACPTGALLGRDQDGGPILDARLCISYLTIEALGPIPIHLRPLIGNRVYGCDICQEVCPWNTPKFVRITSEPAFLPRAGVHGAELIELMGMDQAEFSRRFKGSPVKRAKRRGLLRNVAVALGNWGSPEAVPVLAKALEDEEPLIRGHAAWALGAIAAARPPPDDLIAEIRAALSWRLAVEEEDWVREELAGALTR